MFFSFIRDNCQFLVGRLAKVNHSLSSEHMIDRQSNLADEQLARLSDNSLNKQKSASPICQSFCII